LSEDGAAEAAERVVIDRFDEQNSPARSLTVNNGLPNEFHAGHPDRTERHSGGITAS
jgi:hypothetical protein